MSYLKFVALVCRGQWKVFPRPRFSLNVTESKTVKAALEYPIPPPRVMGYSLLKALAAFPGARRPVLKGVSLQLAFKVHQLVLHALLGVGDAVVVDQGPNLFQEKVQK